MDMAAILYHLLIDVAHVIIVSYPADSCHYSNAENMKVK